MTYVKIAKETTVRITIHFLKKFPYLILKIKEVMYSSKKLMISFQSQNTFLDLTIAKQAAVFRGKVSSF